MAAITSLVSFVSLYRVLCVGCVALTYHCVCWVFSPYVAAFIMSRLVCTFSGYHRDVNEICALPGPTGWPEMSIRHYHTTLRRNCWRPQIWLVISHQSCLCVFQTLIRFYQWVRLLVRQFDGGMVDVTCQVITLCVQWLLILRGPILVCLLAAGFRPGRYHLDSLR